MPIADPCSNIVVLGSSPTLLHVLFLSVAPWPIYNFKVCSTRKAAALKPFLKTF